MNFARGTSSATMAALALAGIAHALAGARVSERGVFIMKDDIVCKVP